MKKNNDILFLGVFLLLIGLLLTIYSISTYSEIKNLKTKIDFELIDDNERLSYEDKYAQYISISEFLNKKLDKNKNLPIKTTSCSYLNYAKHNAIELYKLTNKRQNNQNHKNSTAANIRSLRNRLKDYNTCPNATEYANELDAIILEIENKEKTTEFDQQRMLKFIDGYYDKKLKEAIDETNDDLIIETETLDTDLNNQIEELGLENYLDDTVE